MDRRVFIVTVFCAVVSLTYGGTVDVEKSFKDNQIVPDVLPDAPKEFLKISYPKTKKEAVLGTEIAPKDCQDQPEIQYESDPKALYTLIMADPDAPSRKNPVMREWSHWLVYNIPGLDVKKGTVLSDYIGAGPPKDTGLHRYVFVLYKQPGKIEPNEPIRGPSDTNRGGFKTKEFAAKYNLGKPLAGNFFQAQWDESVDAPHKN